MKKILVTLLAAAALISGASPLFASGNSYFGFKGLNFIPTAELPDESQVLVGITGRPSVLKGISLFPYTLHACVAFRDSIEINMSTTIKYWKKNDLNASELYFFDFRNTPIPFGIKYLIMSPQPENHLSSFAAGYSLPYGLYGVLSKEFRYWLGAVDLHTGFNILWPEIGFFMGSEVKPFAKEGQEPYLLYLEGALAGSNASGKPITYNYSIGYSHMVGNTVYFKIFLRLHNLESTTGAVPQRKTIGVGIDFMKIKIDSIWK